MHSEENCLLTASLKNAIICTGQRPEDFNATESINPQGGTQPANMKLVHRLRINKWRYHHRKYI
jgi:hypothetical protein